MDSHSLLECSIFRNTSLYEPTLTAKKQWQREAEIALLAMEEAAANNRLTIAGGGNGWWPMLQVHIWFGLNLNKMARGERKLRTGPKL